MIIAQPVEWRLDDAPVPYPEALSFMESRAARIHAGEAPETVWLLEHPPLYTAGTSADAHDLLQPDRFPVYQTGRGGQYTYHGPGQRVAYVMLDLNRRGRDVRAYVHGLEEWLILALAKFGVTGERRADRVGIWIDRGNGIEEKIAAIGGIAAHGVTSLKALGVDATMADVDQALRDVFDRAFPPIDHKSA